MKSLHSTPKLPFSPTGDQRCFHSLWLFIPLFPLVLLSTTAEHGWVLAGFSFLPTCTLLTFNIALTFNLPIVTLNSSSHYQIIFLLPDYWSHYQITHSISRLLFSWTYFLFFSTFLLLLLIGYSLKGLSSITRLPLIIRFHILLKVTTKPSPTASPPMSEENRENHVCVHGRYDTPEVKTILQVLDLGCATHRRPPQILGHPWS